MNIITRSELKNIVKSLLTEEIVSMQNDKKDLNGKIISKVDINKNSTNITLTFTDNSTLSIAGTDLKYTISNGSLATHDVGSPFQLGLECRNSL
jgi:hypothetical protein